ncbi:MAG: DUF1934 domain-containing protein [Lachnospiraceae bacterium]|nr:DUF1934 domain-containing protein [Lachnospiraceae bacterium]
MNNNVLITVCGTQTVDNESETIETIHPGTYRSLPDMEVVLYEELLPDDTGNAVNSIKNIMKIQDSQFTLVKRGAIQTEMQFAENHAFHGFYQTPLGTFDMTIHTSALEIQTNEKRIDLAIQYALALNGMHVSDCTMKIKVESD